MFRKVNRVIIMVKKVQDPIYDEMIANKALKERTLILNDYVDVESIYKISYYMDRIKKQDDSKNLPKEDRIITIELSSGGGSITDGNFLMGKIEKFKEEYGYKIITRVNGYAYSMAFMIFIMGTEREIYRYSDVMIHDAATGMNGYMKADEINDVNEWFKRDWIKTKKIIIEKTKITDEQLEDMKARKLDWFMESDEALKLGVATKII